MANSDNNVTVLLMSQFLDIMFGHILITLILHFDFDVSESIGPVFLAYTYKANSFSSLFHNSRLNESPQAVIGFSFLYYVGQKPLARAWRYF